MVEQLICNQPVGGSSPSIGSIQKIELIVGEIPERSNGADCKSVGAAFGGSNPPLPTTILITNSINQATIFKNCGSSSFGRAKAFQALGGGFEPRLPLIADVAQW